jgi:hypothetical protein
VHKYSLTAVAVDELGRPLAEHAGPVDRHVIAWARSLGCERLWALEDCRHVTRTLERALQLIIGSPTARTTAQTSSSRSSGSRSSTGGGALRRSPSLHPKRIWSVGAERRIA